MANYHHCRGPAFYTTCLAHDRKNGMKNTDHLCIVIIFIFNVLFAYLHNKQSQATIDKTDKGICQEVAHRK